MYHEKIYMGAVENLQDIAFWLINIRDINRSER